MQKAQKVKTAADLSAAVFMFRDSFQIATSPGDIETFFQLKD